MSENQNRGIGDMSIFDTMTTEELEEILRLDAQAPEEQESDTEKILYIMEVLAERNKGHTGKTALEAYESFKQNYMPETDNNVIPEKPKRGCPRWIRSLTAAAAVLAFLLVGTVTARAFGFNFWKTVIQWTQETFHFGDWGSSDVDNNLPYDSLQDALEQGKAPTWLVPTVIPEGFALTDISVEQTPLKRKYTAIYANGEKKIRIIVQEHLDESPIYVEQSGGAEEEYDVSGITYHLSSNHKNNRAVWLYDSYECDISGDISIDELKEMINSIQKG